MSLRVALVGHVDNGKSTVIGRLLLESGQTHEEKQERVRTFCASTGRRFEYAFLLDALEEEQSQGITLDVTEVNWRYRDRDFLFVDTPGHREFIKKMVGGASRVDAAVQVLDAVEGINDSFRRQSKMLDHLGIEQRIVILNKMDLVNWNKEIWLQRREQVLAYTGSTRLRVIPVAAWHGENLLQPSSLMKWYDGPTLAEAIYELQPSRPANHLPLRFYIQDVYKFDERRVFVGRVESGTVKVNDAIVFSPGNLTSRVLSLECCGNGRDEAYAGDAIGMTLADPLFLDRGHLGHSPQNPVRVSRSASADLFWLDSQPLKHGDRLKIKAGTQAVGAVVEKIEFDLQIETLAERPEVQSVSTFGRVTFKFDKDWCFDAFTDCEVTGRFVATQEGRVLGGGRWVDEASLTAAPSTKAKGSVIWFTGLSGSGKSATAQALDLKLRALKIPCAVLDGDIVRQGLCRDLGFSAEDRAENIRRAAEMAKLMADSGLVVIAAFISPLAAHRQLARNIIGEDRFAEVFIDCPLAQCEDRDPKGLYARVRAGRLKDFSGIDAPFEAPKKPDLQIRTDQSSVENATDSLIALLRELDRFYQ